MPLSTDRAAQKEGDAREIVAMAFRDDHTAEKVTISNLSFEGCSVASAAKFAVQERLRLHLRGQGWIEAQVRSVSGELSDVVFVTHPGV